MFTNCGTLIPIADIINSKHILKLESITDCRVRTLLGYPCATILAFSLPKTPISWKKAMLCLYISSAENKDLGCVVAMATPFIV